MLVACATNDKINLIDDHFGDAKYYNIYNIDDGIITFIKSIENTITSIVHPDPSKAIKILELLKKEDITILINKAFGANIKVIKKYAIPALIKVNKINEALKLLNSSYDTIQDYIKTAKNFYLVISSDGKIRIIENLKT